ETSSHVQLILINQLGDIVFTGSYTSGKHHVNAGQLETGIYTARLITEKGVKTMRLVRSE
ncbi:MAG TPA: T9SS type A sorting domain-containing protein, partial [Bacteroidia bacterium]|nr:T9SS type A sorting domain-containing protein [Bacteroidia bacterium]